MNLIKAVYKKLLTGKKYFYKYRCSVCMSRVSAFRPLSKEYKLNAEKYGYKYFGQNEHLNIEKYSCPICNSSDRDRLYASFFIQFELGKEKNKKLLHVAPAWQLNNRFLVKHFDVTTTDLNMDNVDYKLNIEDMKIFNDNTFDYFICSHVLEHVNHPDKALKELYRILRPGGKGIIMAPIIPELEKTLEDPNHKTEAERIKNYGQSDHFRLFAKNDFTNRITNANFKLKTFGVNDFKLNVFKVQGIKNSSILYIGEK